MALTEFQRTICRLIASNRIAAGESYIAGAVALNELIRAPRVSGDIDLFHDTERAVSAAWDADRDVLERAGFTVTVIRELASFVEARITRGPDPCVMQWARDSAFRFFPLVEHSEFGLVLHPFDLATNKVLALVGRLEVRDWVDVISCDEHIQPLGYLAWAAAAKDPGFSPAAILEHAARTAHYSQAEVKELAFEGAPPDAAALSRKWHAMLGVARAVVALLPTEEVGRAVVDQLGGIYRGAPRELEQALARHAIAFHEGRIRGAWPRIVLPG
jgi:hypothetical protein